MNREPLKILQVTAALSEGGVERGTLEMAAFTISKGAQSYVASSGGKLVPALEGYGAIHYNLPLNKRNPFSIFYSAMMLVKIIRKHQIGLVHARSRAPAWAALLASKITSTPFITTFHGTHKIQNVLKKFYNSSMVRGERVIAISQFIKNHVIENYSVQDDLVDVAPRGFDSGEFNPEMVSFQERKNLRGQLGLREDDFVITLPGRLTRWKGQTVFLQALSHIKDRPWQALIIGGAGKKKAYECELKELCTSLLINERVHFLGSQSKIAKYYAISDLVISASVEPEAFGRVAVEAQAMKKPVIASAHGGSLETVRNSVTGWLYHADSPADLAEKILLACDEDTDLQEMGNRGRRWVEENFTVENMCRAEWQAYDNVLTKRK